MILKVHDTTATHLLVMPTIVPSETAGCATWMATYIQVITSVLSRCALNHWAGLLEGEIDMKRILRTSVENYKPYEGFFDLRKFDLPKKLFRSLWIIQDTLHEMNKNKEYYKKFHMGQWLKAQQISADYQQVLFSYKKQRRQHEGNDSQYPETERLS